MFLIDQNVNRSYVHVMTERKIEAPNLKGFRLSRVCSFSWDLRELETLKIEPLEQVRFRHSLLVVNWQFSI